MGLGVGVSGSDFLSLVKIIANAITIPKTTKTATTMRMIMPLFDLERKGKLCFSTLVLEVLSGNVCKSGPLHFGSEKSFPSNFAL